jgi:hypothetical protein
VLCVCGVGGARQDSGGNSPFALPCLVPDWSVGTESARLTRARLLGCLSLPGPFGPVRGGQGSTCVRWSGVLQVGLLLQSRLCRLGSARLAWRTDTGSTQAKRMLGFSAGSIAVPNCCTPSWLRAVPLCCCCAGRSCARYACLWLCPFLQRLPTALPVLVLADGCHMAAQCP